MLTFISKDVQKDEQTRGGVFCQLWAILLSSEHYSSEKLPYNGSILVLNYKGKMRN